MRVRKQEIGSKNIVGRKIEARRKELNMKQGDLLTQIQIRGIEINASGLSKIEGQLRSVSDYELKAIAGALDIDVNELLGITKDE
ncbi:MAG: XRE family transcriptional regulator [Clostridia bacterium]|nr:XRE family transcriptional regulator [Clostridia bacterium]